MNAEDAIRTRRSVRRYRDEPISSTEIELLIDAAVWAPSGRNRQTWRLVVVTERLKIRRLRMVSPGMPGPPPCVIAVCQDMGEAETYGSEETGKKLALFDSAMAVQNILIAAWSVGIGSCVVASFNRTAVRRMLDLPKTIEPILLVTVGRPAEEPPAPRRKKDGIIHYEKYSE